jgi:phosphate-selective porin
VAIMLSADTILRYTELNVDPRVFADGFVNRTKSAGSARAWTVGLNWYLNYFSKVEFN